MHSSGDASANRLQRLAAGSYERRNFITTLSKAAGSVALLNIPFFAAAKKPAGTAAPTVGDIMDLFIQQVPAAPFEHTVDTLKAGTRSMPVSGIVTTMFATIPVINQAVDSGANFIIAHEPTFYNGNDETGWLQEDSVYQYKKALLEKHGIAVWRNHDYVHSLAADGVREGVLAQLDWKKWDTGKGDNLLLAHLVSLQAIIGHLKEKLNIQMVRFIGNERQLCQRVLLMPGAAGGRNQIMALSKNKPDLLICGELQEWETAEYVRDARAAGEQLALIVLGHIASEEPGSEWMANWLKQHVPGIPVTHIHPGNSLQFA